MSCAHKSTKAPEQADDIKMRRHGWAIFSGPIPTRVNSNDAASVERGHFLYKQHCAKCHGKNGKGDGPYADNLKHKPANLTVPARISGSHYIVYQVSNGRGDMPSWNEVLTPKETWDISNFVKSLQKKL